MLAVVDRQRGLFDAAWCSELLPEGSIYSLLAEHGDRIVRDEDFADCYWERRGRTTSAPNVIAKGPGRALYFTEQFAGQIGCITARGKVTEYAIPSPDEFPVEPIGITKGPGGDTVWFTHTGSTTNPGEWIGKLTIHD